LVLKIWQLPPPVGGGGSGGAVWLQAADLVIDGQVNAQGRTGGTSWPGNLGGSRGDGLVRIDNVDQTGTGNVLPASGFDEGR
jgi:hypothetical protein